MKFFLTYLIMPIMAIIFGIVVYLISKKNKLLKNKKFIFYVLLSGVILAVPALLGFIQYWFIPYIYILLSLLYLLLGYLNMKYVDRKMSTITEHGFVFEFLFCIVVMFVGMALFSIVFNLVNELKYGIWASTCLLTFAIPILYRKTYRSYLAIPLEIYKVWTTNTDNTEPSKEQLDITNLMVIDIELFKDIADTDLLHITAKTSENISFGAWFEIFLTDYNKKSPLSPIQYHDEDDPYGWIFYIKSSFFKRRKYVDPDLSIKENKIKAHDAIIARRARIETKHETSFTK